MAREARRQGFFASHGLSIVALGLFAGLTILQILAGWKTFNQDQLLHGGKTLSMLEYLGESHFWSALLENWESEFLQMGLLVVMSEELRQRGSAQSRKMQGDDEEELKREREIEEEAARQGKTPWPVKKGGWIGKAYENSLFTVLMLMFFLTFAGHFAASYLHSRQEMAEHGLIIPTVASFVREPEFWFESMQNWQSEFLSVFTIVVLSIWLRAHNSTESKPVGAAHDYTGH